MKLILITGCSGAGKSVALKAFEDLGIACMDNIPMSVIRSMIGAVELQLETLAICSDVRSPDFNPVQFLDEVAELKKHYDCRLLFLTARQEVLVARFNATKHRHPLFCGDSVMESLRREETLLASLRMAADEVIDTSHYTPHMLKSHLVHLTGMQREQLSIQLTSFSYQLGLPENADLVFDVRFLKNPYYVLPLREKTGKDSEVVSFLEQDPNLAPYLHQLTQLLSMLFPLYQLEGKSYLTIAVGCTGGRHRSVYVVESLRRLLDAPALSLITYHRELEH
jgi:RNase adapter protein RapZ